MTAPRLTDKQEALDFGPAADESRASVEAYPGVALPRIRGPAAGQRCHAAGQGLEEVGARGRCLSDRNVCMAIETIADAADCAHDVFEVTEL